MFNDLDATILTVDYRQDLLTGRYARVEGAAGASLAVAGPHYLGGAPGTGFGQADGGQALTARTTQAVTVLWAVLLRTLLHARVSRAVLL